jgi:hypothetical protein
MFLQIPVQDFDLLPVQLGCSLLRSRGRLELFAEAPGCSLTFEVDGERALLSHLHLHEDLAGRFMRDVPGALFLAYQGDLEATLEWTAGLEQPPLSIVAGETNHPLLSGPPEPAEPPGLMPVSTALIEQWLADAHHAWSAYQQQRAPSRDDSR